jgi:hypothetical protein
MENLTRAVAKFSGAPEREILGFDISECIKFKFPPAKVSLKIDKVPFTIGKSDYSGYHTRWLTTVGYERCKGLSVQRAMDENLIEDSYSIDDIRYTHSFEYFTRTFRRWNDETRRMEIWTIDLFGNWESNSS